MISSWSLPMHVFRLESHLQSPAHQVAPCPREHSSQLGARWLPQLTEFVVSENRKEIFFGLALNNSSENLMAIMIKPYS